MSRAPERINRPLFPDLPDEIEEIVHKFSPHPAFKGRDQALAFLRGEIPDASGNKFTPGLDIRLFAITDAVENRSIEFVKVGAAVFFSGRGLARWIFTKYNAPKISA